MKQVAICVLAGAAFAMLSAIPAVAGNDPQARQTRAAWPAETISGTISTVDSGQKVVVVTSDSVPFDMIITPKTRIVAGSESVKFKDLGQYENKNVSVRFVPEGRGDVAESIRING